MTNSMIWFKSPIAEMKRLYVRADDRGPGAGKDAGGTLDR